MEADMTQTRTHPTLGIYKPSDLGYITRTDTGFDFDLRGHSGMFRLTQRINRRSEVEMSILYEVHNMQPVLLHRGALKPSDHQLMADLYYRYDEVVEEQRNYDRKQFMIEKMNRDKKYQEAVQN